MLSGLTYLSTWSGMVLEQAAWKYSLPQQDTTKWKDRMSVDADGKVRACLPCPN